MDKGTQEEVDAEEAKWKATLAQTLREITECIGSLKSYLKLQEKGEKVLLSVSFTLDAFEKLESLFSSIDVLRTHIEKQSAHIATLETRLELLEAESAKTEKDRRISEL